MVSDEKNLGLQASTTTRLNREVQESPRRKVMTEFVYHQSELVRRNVFLFAELSLLNIADILVSVLMYLAGSARIVVFSLSEVTWISSIAARISCIRKFYPRKINEM